MRKSRALSAFVLGGLLLVAPACSKSDGGDKPKADSTTTSAPTKSASSTKKKDGHVSSPKLPTLPKITKATGIRNDATLTSCSTEQGDVVAKGTVRNSSSKPADVLVTVNWINATYDVVARGADAVKAVAPGKAADWSVKANIPQDYGKVTCVLNVRRGVLG
jgi:hypothetical protein